MSSLLIACYCSRYESEKTLAGTVLSYFYFYEFLTVEGNDPIFPVPKCIKSHEYAEMFLLFIDAVY